MKTETKELDLNEMEQASGGSLLTPLEWAADCAKAGIVVLKLYMLGAEAVY